MKNILLKFVMLMTLIGFSISVATAKPITIKFSHVVAENTPKGQMANEFKRLVEENEKLKGKVEVEVFPNSQLFADEQVLEAILLGDVQLAAPSLSMFKKYTKKLQLFDFPFLFKDMEAVERFQSSEAGQALLDSLNDKGLMGLGYLHNGFKQLTSSKPLKVPADAAKEKFRIMSSDVLVAQFEAVDAVPVKKPFSEVFTLLQTKAIDGQENTWSNIYSKKFFEVQPYITESNHGLLDYMLITSQEFWNGLDDDIRAELEADLNKAIKLGNKVSIEKAQSDKQAITDSGRSEIITLTNEERQQWVEKMKPVWKQFEGQVGAENLEAAIQANQE